MLEEEPTPTPSVEHLRIKMIKRKMHVRANFDLLRTLVVLGAPTGIDYLHLVERQHTAELADRVQYSRLHAEPVPDEPVPDEPVPDGHVRGQIPLPGIGDEHAVSDETGEVSA